MAAKFQYIPGARNTKTGKQIPWMSKGLGDASFKAGVQARMFGFEAVKRNLNIVLGKVLINTVDGLVNFAFLLKEDMLITSPTVPKSPNGGKLRDSYYVTPVSLPGMGPSPAAVEAGFSAPYALYVHEMTDDAYSKKINWSEPGSGAKFFQYALQRNAKKLLTEVGIATKIAI